MATNSDSFAGDADVDADAVPYARRCRSCGQGVLQLVMQTLRPTVAELLRMPPDMKHRAVQLRLPFSGFT